MEDNIISPSYTIADHKFLFINLLNKEITANMILRHIAGMYLIGIDYIETFVDSLDTSNIPKDLLEFLKTFIQISTVTMMPLLKFMRIAFIK